jgi:GNAT superfamily N-acetyltransferase
MKPCETYFRNSLPVRFTPQPSAKEVYPMDEDFLVSEQIERTALIDLHAAASDSVREQLGLRLETIGTALVSIATGEPHNILLNRTIGLGIETPADQDTVKAVVARYAAERIHDYFLHLHPKARPAELRSWLTQAGLRKGRGWMKFLRDTQAPPQAQSDLRVQRIGSERAEDFARIAAPCFDFSAAAIPLIAALVERHDWLLYMSFDGDTPAGTGAIFVQDDVAYLDWGATLPAYRRRGGQGAVMSRRIGDAIDLGCRLLVTVTGEAVPGDPQHSYKNILRAGFRPTYLRENFVPV